jgi:plastocyanin
MRFLTVAILALLVWALPSAAVQAASPEPASAAAISAAAKKRALKKALKKCRTIRRATRRKACVRKARKRFTAKPHKPAKPKPGKTWRVDVIDKAFTPESLEIKQGDSILWIWNDMNKEAHDVKLESGPPGINRADYATSNTPSINYQWSRRLDKTGTWVFYCSIHHLMRMAVKVGK